MIHGQSSYSGGVSFVPEIGLVCSRKRHSFILTSYGFIQQSFELFLLIRRAHHTDKNFITISFRHIHTTYMHAAYGFIRGVRIIRRHSLLASYTLHISFSRCHIITSYSIIISLYHTSTYLRCFIKSCFYYIFKVCL